MPARKSKDYAILNLPPLTPGAVRPPRPPLKRLQKAVRKGRKPKPLPKPRKELPKAPAVDPSELIRAREISAMAKAVGVKTYGFLTEEQALRMPPWEVEFCALRDNPPGGLGRSKHFELLAKLLWPALEQNWNPWLERMVSSVYREHAVQRIGETVVRATSWLGCASAGKTYASALISLLWWSVDPFNSIVILTSTTTTMVRKRVWPEIRNLYDTSVDLSSGKLLRVPGFVMESKTAIQAGKHDDKHAIFAMAVAHGETAKAVAKMKGMHAKRILLIIDEANGTPESIYRTVANLRKGCKEFNVILISNPTSHLDCAGMASEPEAGWKSVSVESDEWVTKAIPEWQIPSGLAMHFDGFRSPNVQLGETRWSFLYTWEDYQNALTSPSDTIEYWQNDRGFYAGEGVVNTVFTEGLVERCKGYERPPFLYESTPVAFLDPAFGGDDCVLQFGAVGHVAGGRLALVLTEMLILNPLVHSGMEKEYVIAEQAIRACKDRGVKPQHFGVDAVGTGRGCASVIAMEWDAAVQKFASNERPSEEIGVRSDRAANKEYDRATTEHWFRARDLLESGQLKGLYREAVVQFCSRQFEVVGKVYRLSTKQEHKESVASRESPDKADAVVGLCWVARGLGLAPEVGTKREDTRQEELNEAVYAEEGSYSEPQEYNNYLDGRG